MGKTKKVLAMILAAVIILTCTFAADAGPVRASQEKYDGEDGITSYEALGEFTQSDIKYYITSYPYGGKNGEVYVAGCTFSKEKISIPSTTTHSGRTYNVVGINNKAFENYENLTSVTVADGLTYIGAGAFWGCWYLESITLPKTLKELGEAAFEYCGSLKSISFPDALTVIPDYACAYSAVSKVTLGSKVTSIGYCAFYECKNIKEITLPATLKTIENYAFNNCRNLGKITNKSKLKEEDYKKAFEDTKWERGKSKPAVDYQYSDKDMVISVYLDNKKLTKGYLYYRMNDYRAEDRCLDYDDWEHGVWAELKKDDDGNFTLDKKFIESSGYPIYGDLYYCKSKPKDFLKAYYITFTTGDIPYTGEVETDQFSEDTQKGVRPVVLYTVHYEQGEHECRFLPKDRILGRYGSIEIGEDVEQTGQGFLTQDPVSPGRAFAYYADSSGKRLDSVKDITGPVSVHPVFVNEDELYTGKDYAAERYYNYNNKMHHGDTWNELAENVTVKSGEKLTERLVTDDTKGLCIIDKKVTLSPNEVAKYRKGVSEDSWEWKYTKDSGYIYNYRDMIVVKSGGTLILDGIYLSNEVRISLQKGAKLKIINGTNIQDAVLGVQEGAEVEIVNSSINAELMNAGTITVTGPAYKRSADSFYAGGLSAEPFFNTTTGVINIDYGSLSWGIDFDMDYGPGTQKSDMRDLDDAVVVNNGTVNVIGYGHLFMGGGYQCWEHKEIYDRKPIVNNGTINIVSSADRYYLFSMFKLECDCFYNFGTVKLTSDVKRSNKFADSYAIRTAVYEIDGEADMELSESAFINYGTLDIDVKNGLGIFLCNSRFPRDRVLKHFEEDGYTASHGRIENREGGKINIVTDNGCGIAVGTDSYLINNGTLTIKDKDANSKEPSLLICGKLINNSKLTNNGSIGYSAACMYSSLKNYDLDNGYSGKQWSGSGRELLGYELKLSGTGSYSGSNIYVNSGKSVLVNGKHYAAGNQKNETVFLPVNTKVKMTVKLSGYADKTVEYTTAKSVKDFIDNAYKNLKAGSDPRSYITVSMSKGSGTADKSVTAYPMDIDDQIVIDNMYYSVTTSDLKGGTVCFEHTGYSVTSLVIPDTITYEGRTYKVTMMGRFDDRNLTSLTIGANVSCIEDRAFEFLPALKTLVIKSKQLKGETIGLNAFANVPDSCVITVPKAKLKGYKKIFKAAGLSNKVKVKGKK